MKNVTIVYRCIEKAYLKRFKDAPALTREKLSAILAAYSEGIKEGIQKGALIRIDNIGSLQPQKIRTKRSDNNKWKLNVDNPKDITYLCSASQEIKPTDLKVKEYVNHFASSDTENT